MDMGKWIRKIKIFYHDNNFIIWFCICLFLTFYVLFERFILHFECSMMSGSSSTSRCRQQLYGIPIVTFLYAIVLIYDIYKKHKVKKKQDDENDKTNEK